MNTENPWLNISWENTIAECDKKAIEEFNKGKDSELKVDTELLPEPFTGDIETCKVVILNLNPGISDGDELFKGNQQLLDLTQKTLKHQLGHSMWFDEIRDSNGELHPGCKWWKSRTKTLRQKLGGENSRNDDGKYLKMFVLEFFPYHTRNASEFPELASDKYRNYLLNKAMEAGKLIVIMRGARLWGGIDAMTADGKTLGDKLSEYGNLLILRNKQGAYLTPHNLRKAEKFDLKPLPQSNQCWNELLARLK